MADIRAIAQAYIDQGWAVVPLVKGEKRAASDWQNKTYTPKDFNTTDGIAGKNGKKSGWRVDVDLDSPEAIEAARLLLPHTGLVHGRPGKPDSHYWFICKDAKTTQFTDVKDSSGKTNMLVEIRSTGGYTALPPSGHPSGDTLAWTSERDPMEMEWDDLHSIVRQVAIATLMGRHWPGSGARHHFVGHFTGFLLQAGIPGVEVARIIEVTAIIAKDPDLHDRVVFAAGTIAKYDNGENVTGGPKLAEELGEDVVSKLRAWLRVADLDALEAMNEKHFFVRMGSKSVIGRTDDPNGVVFQPVRELYPEYANRMVQVGVGKKGEVLWKPLFTAWLESTTRRDYQRVVLAPPPLAVNPETDYNLWTGFAVEPKEGDCSRYLAHLRENICRDNEEYYQYLLKFCALTLQSPGTLPGVAVVMRGRPGTGKGTMMRMFANIFGRRHYTHLSRTEELVRWNSLVSGKVIVFADEAFFAGDKEHHGALKRLITEPTITISRKHLESTEEANCLHLFMATNENWAVPAQQGERRYFVLDVADEHEQEATYFTPLYEEMAHGGTAAFLALMLRTSTSVAEIRNAPKTAELRHQQEQSLAYHFQWLQECLWDGVIGPAGWKDWVSVDLIYEAYKFWVKERTNRFLSKIEFGRQIHRPIMTAQKSEPKRLKGKLIRSILLRPLVEARAEFDKKMRTISAWEDL